MSLWNAYPFAEVFLCKVHSLLSLFHGFHKPSSLNVWIGCKHRIPNCVAVRNWKIWNMLIKWCICWLGQASFLTDSSGGGLYLLIRYFRQKCSLQTRLVACLGRGYDMRSGARQNWRIRPYMILKVLLGDFFRCHRVFLSLWHRKNTLTTVQ